MAQCIFVWVLGGAHFLGRFSTKLGAEVLYTLRRAQTHTNFHQTTNPYPYQSQAAAPQLPVPILGKGTKRVRKGRPRHSWLFHLPLSWLDTTQNLAPLSYIKVITHRFSPWSLNKWASPSSTLSPDPASIPVCAELVRIINTYLLFSF